jgi:3-isopropylmalate/(R)-2-methylmalate dehydratase large subunit
MTLAEKILARAAVRNLATGEQGLGAVSPGDGLLVKVDWRISHEGATLLAATMLDHFLEKGLPFRDPDHILAFRDHLAFKDHFQGHDEHQSGLPGTVQRMNSLQVTFCRSWGIHLQLETPEGNSEGISHILMTDRYVLPGQVVVGTDSHTCHAGALGALAFCVGAADLANAWVTGDVPMVAPSTCLVRLNGKLPPGVHAKDLVLHLLALPALNHGKVKGKVIEYQGEALASLSTDERSTLTSMAADLGALAGIVAPDEETRRFLRERRGLELDLEPWMGSDPDARFAMTVEVDCSSLGAMVAAPGDPSQGLRLETLARDVPVDIAYVGSCTGGKREDIERVYEVVRWALDHGLKLPLQVQFFIQLASEDVRRHASSMGWIRAFEDAGARILPPGCGACINAGPGVSTRADQVTISAVNRNFPGRSGPGQVWLAASAFCGKICGFKDLVSGTLKG